MTQPKYGLRGRPLTARELQIVQLMGTGLTNAAIGQRLHLSPLTVKSHLARIAQRLGCGSRAYLVAHCLRQRLITVTVATVDRQPSERERQVLEDVAKGMTNEAIGRRLYICTDTVKTHLVRLSTRVDAHSRAQLVAIAWGNGWISE